MPKSKRLLAWGAWRFGWKPNPQPWRALRLAKNRSPIRLRNTSPNPRRVRKISWSGAV